MIAVFRFFALTKTGRLCAAVLVGAVFIASVYALWGNHARLKDRAKDLESVLELEQGRARDDAYLQNLEDDHLCLEYFRGFGRVRDPAECRALRGVHSK
ncbi:hypothetical protein J7444_19685 [Labrenzia sp. R4_1]|uniref:hypothetical protein n=1 Tax=Labrenzia sp. R4_1 TaxID=2821106 RepID=UPI001ADAE318|nr:hypothetical protein [Labrenzia sp. R4_1]MBO9426966.1 hypothetical protein [Labrenzia sp. R4_1]